MKLNLKEAKKLQRLVDREIGALKECGLFEDDNELLSLKKRLNLSVKGLERVEKERAEFQVELDKLADK